VSTSPPASEHAVDTAIRYFGKTVNMFDPLRFRAWAEMGLTTAQLRVLFLVRESPGVTAGELAHKIGVTPPTISGIVDRLVKMDLVRREDDESDRDAAGGENLDPFHRRPCVKDARGSKARHSPRQAR